MSTSLWKQRISINSVDLYAWGERVDDLYAQQNSQVAIFVHIDGAVCLCVLGPNADARTVMLIEFTRLLLSTVCRRPSHLALTYRGATAGLNLTFATLEDLEAFKTYAPQHASPRMILARPDGLHLTGEEDITTGYERSFGRTHAYRTCNFLYANLDGHLPSDVRADHPMSPASFASTGSPVSSFDGSLASNADESSYDSSNFEDFEPWTGDDLDLLAQKSLDEALEEDSFGGIGCVTRDVGSRRMAHCLP